jgi:hypothetical protein
VAGFVDHVGMTVEANRRRLVVEDAVTDRRPVSESPAQTRPSPSPLAAPDEPAPVDMRAATPPAGTARGTLELVGLVVAPTTLVTALAFYFGWVLTNSRASYLRIDASLFGFSTQDYLLRSVDALFVPLGAIFVLGLLVLWLHSLAMRQLADLRRGAGLRIAAGAGVLVGGALFAIGIAGVFNVLSFSPYYLVPSATPGIGIGLLAYGVYLRRRIEAVERPSRPPSVPAVGPAASTALVAMVVVLSAFWTASRYAEAVGRGRAQRLAASLSTLPQVTVFAPRRLDVTAPGVVEQRLVGADRAYHYRYSGLRLLIRSASKYFLLPNGWTRATGSAIVLSDSPDYRFEFGAG